MKVLVTGGCGYVGRHLVDALAARGDDVRVLAVPGEDARAVAPRDVEVRRGDVRDPNSVTSAVAGVDAVVHLAAMMHVWRPLADYCAVNVVGTANVARAARDAEVRRFVHMSSSSVYGADPRTLADGTVDESVPLDPFPDPYPVTKAAADRLVLRMAADEGLRGVVVRPDQIFGPGDHLHFGAFVERLRSGRGIVVGTGDNVLPLVYVTDVVQGLLLALDHEAAVGEAFNLTNDEPLTQLEFLQEVSRCIGVTPRWHHLPSRPLLAMAGIAERAPYRWWGADRPPVTRLGVAFLGSDVRCRIDKARARLGFRPAVPITTGVRLSCDEVPVAPQRVAPNLRRSA